jgi:phosphatidylserine/phosphatidylglycerophosphate/cardiolipin synthase-like enzyme
MPATLRTVFCLVWLTASPGWAADERPKVELLTERAYEARVGALIDGAQRSIEVTMYQANLPSDADDRHPVRKLLDRLIARSKAGIAVKVVLDAGTPEDGAVWPSAIAAAYLVEHKVDVRWDEDDRTTHTKSLVVDGRWCLIGSTNWSYSALRKNREQSVLLDDADLAKRMDASFQSLWKKSRPVTSP